ncbi:MAG: hypothetical protein AAF722_08615 [Cyanobacteria bacterium P01_C01_bin.70]
MVTGCVSADPRSLLNFPTFGAGYFYKTVMKQLGRSLGPRLWSATATGQCLTPLAAQ